MYVTIMRFMILNPLSNKHTVQHKIVTDLSTHLKTCQREIRGINPTALKLLDSFDPTTR